MVDSAITKAPVEIVGDFLHDAPVNLAELVNALGLEIEIVQTLPPNVSGKIERKRGTYRITVNGQDSPFRQRFTTAHEIAHYVLHRDLIGDGVTDDALYRSAALSDHIESQANRYAADILMPAALVKKLFRSGHRSLSDLSNAFQVSSDAIRIRLNDLGLGA